jgi:hypothetical protein
MEKRSPVGVVTAVSCSGVHGFSKPVQDSSDCWLGWASRATRT